MILKIERPLQSKLLEERLSSAEAHFGMNPTSQNAQELFAALVDTHFYLGTEPKMGVKNRPWSNALIAGAIGVSPSTASAWRNGRRLPTRNNFFRLLKLLFGDEWLGSEEAMALVKVYSIGAFRDLNIEDFGDDEIDESSLQQVPAAFRFGVKDNKIDALPEDAKKIDAVVSNEIYIELQSKVNILVDRLRKTNSDPYALFSLERLRDGLSDSIDGVRPGIILSRMRNVEAVRDAFDSEEGRSSLFPDAIAAFEDVCSSGQDFLATFPVVREIERQRIALELDRRPEILQSIQSEAVEIQKAALDSEIVAPGAVKALEENEVDIQKAQNPIQKADLISDKLLIIRNFASEALRSIIHSGSGAWGVVKPDFEEGAKHAARILPPLAVIALLVQITGPIAGLAGIIHSGLFRSIKDAIPKVTANHAKRD